jgi:hypothetical protein
MLPFVFPFFLIWGVPFAPHLLSFYLSKCTAKLRLKSGISSFWEQIMCFWHDILTCIKIWQMWR